METVSSVTDQFVISLSLLANIDPDAVTHPDLRIELLGDPVDLGSEQYARLVQQWGHPTDCRVSNELDELLMAVLQQYEQSSQQYETNCTVEKLDELFLEASQLLDVEPLNNSMVVKPSGKPGASQRWTDRQSCGCKTIGQTSIWSTSKQEGYPGCKKKVTACTEEDATKHWVGSRNCAWMGYSQAGAAAKHWKLRIGQWYHKSTPAVNHWLQRFKATLHSSTWTLDIQLKPVCHCCYFALLVLLGFI